MANRVKGKRKAAAAKRGHKKISKRKSSAGTRKAAMTRWNKNKKRKKK